MRRLLLDTHTLLWWLADDPRLGPHTRTLIADGANEVYVSAASAWEISIKKALGKLKAPADLDSVVQDEGFAQLEISFFHGEKAGELPPLHRDPFDRMVIAQARVENLTLVTRDPRILKYEVALLEA